LQRNFPEATTPLGKRESLLSTDFYKLPDNSAPGATIVYVYASDVTQALQYAIDQNLAPVVSFSFSVCESRSGGDWRWYRSLAQQAVAQGITWVACTGDTGAAGCEFQLKDQVGVSGAAINVPASVPEVTAVGGTTFAEGTGKYWSATNQADLTSAVSYIPEVGWNDTAPGTFLNSSGGGVSSVFARPAWQTGPGVPNDNARHTPDIAFTASGVHDPYLIVQTGSIVPTGGTSASTPFFAGILALLNQYVVSTGVQAQPGLGNINPRLYQLAQSAPSVFHDVTGGNNIVPCKAGTPDCTTGRYGYNAGPGYDHVTGLGSIDAANLLNNWSEIKSNPKGSSVVNAQIDPSPVYQQAPDDDGYSWFYTIRLSETGGVASKLTGFSIDGYDLSGYIADWFGTSTIPANGSLSLKMRGKDMAVPSDLQFGFAGIDDSGQQWSKKISAPFRAPTRENRKARPCR
jgi:subtilase family serine protease